MEPPRPILLTMLLVLAACGHGAAADAEGAAPPTTTAPTTTVPTTTVPTTTVPTTTVPATTVPATTVPATTVPATTVPATTVPARLVHETAYGVLADADGVEVVLPAATVEMVGFHEAGHDGSRQMGAATTAVPVTTMETRDRGTGSRTAADIVVDPDTEIRSPVTGTVLRGGSYILYCDHTDDFVVIEPDARPGWEVKMFHFAGLQLSAGDRVEAGITVVAPRAAVLPFESQVDELSAEPSWPHVHVEVIDPSIPDRPSAGGGC